MNDILMISYSFFIMLFEQLIMLVLWSGFVELKKSKLASWVGLITLLIGLSLLINILIGNAVNSIIFIVLANFIVLVLFYKGKWYLLLFCATMGMIYLKCIDNIVIYCTSLVCNISPDVIMANAYYFILLSLLSKTSELIFAWVIRNVFRKRFVKNSSHWNSWLSTLPLPIAVCYLLAFSLNLSFNYPETAQQLLTITIVFLGLSILQFLIAKKLDEKEKVEEEYKQLQQTLYLQKESIQSLSEAFTTQRSLSHEFNNIITILDTLVHNKNYQEAEKYMSTIYGKVQRSAIIVATNNPVIDAVLNQKYRICVAKAITIDFDLCNLKNLPFPEEDIAVIVSNLLSNAIEATELCAKNKTITIKTRLDENEMLLMVTNHFVKPPVIDGNSFKSSKIDTILHGFGLKNVIALLDALNAEHTIDYSNNIFTFLAYIPVITAN